MTKREKNKQTINTLKYVDVKMDEAIGSIKYYCDFLDDIINSYGNEYSSYTSKLSFIEDNIIRFKESKLCLNNFAKVLEKENENE